MLDKKSKFLLLILIISLIGAIVFIYYRSYIENNFVIDTEEYELMEDIEEL